MFKPGDVNEEGKEIEQDGSVTWEIQIPVNNCTTCDICGKEFDRRDAAVLSTGRRRITMCPECYKSGSNAAEHQRIKRAEAIKRKRNKDKI